MAEISSGSLVDGRYRVLSRLGSGGMADVFLAEDQQLGRNVALKLLHRRFAEDPGFVERFRREAQAAAGLQHPNVVSVYDRGAHDGTYYIAMEYLPGRSLKQLIRSEAPLDPIRAIDITIQMLKAARFAHRRGVIHRDLKPHNVIVDEADQVKVTDFGIARAGASDMTETGSIMGTAQYLSPEQAQGRAVSAGSDLYSIGVVLYELLTGRVPFDAEAAVTIALKHVSESPTAPTQLNPNVPPELEQVVMWALNKNPTDRPGDADQFITALEQAKAAIVARQRGQRTASMAALAGVAAGGGALGAAGADLGPEPPPGDEEPGGDGAGVLVAGEPPPPPGRRRPTRREWALIALLLALLLGGAAAAYLLTRPAQRIVPTVVGEQVNIARTQLQNAGFKVGVINVTSDRPSGTVIGQKPLGASKADQGSTVNLTVSQGPGNTTVPSVVGESQQAAKQTLARARLTVSRVEHEASNTVSAGDATRTEPSAGFSVPVGTGVTLFISSGRPVTLVTVPDVTGQPESSATATLRGQGFHVTTSTQPSANTPSGNVISQDPTGGSRVRPGSTVSLVVSSGAAKATVPDVTGQTAGAARGALSGAGFSVSEQSTDVTDKSKDGVVISQSPPGGSSADPGSTVTIVVGHFKAPPTKPTTSTTTSTSNTTTKP